MHNSRRSSCRIIIWFDGQMVLSLLHLECFPDGCQLILASTKAFFYFHQLLQLFRTHGLLPPHVPRESSSLANGCRRMFSISPDSSTPPSPRDSPLLERKRQALNHGWEVVSQLCLLPGKKHWHLSSFDIAAVNAVLVPNLPATRFLPSNALCNHSTF